MESTFAGRKLYTLVFTHAIGYPYFSDLLYADIPKTTLSYKGYIKKYSFQLAKVIQSDTTFKLVLVAISVNVLYERCLNF